MGSAQAHGETLMASGGEKSRNETEMALGVMAKDKCSAGEMITAVARQTAAQEAVIAIQDEFTDNDQFVLLLSTAM